MIKIMFAIDTNLLVYAHNADSKFNQSACLFLEKMINGRNLDGQCQVCIPSQVFMEFINVITWDKLPAPLTLAQAIMVVEDYLHSGVRVISPQATQMQTFLELLRGVKSRKKIFDVALAAMLKDNDIEGIYTVNVKDFKEFEFLKVVNPLGEYFF